MYWMSEERKFEVNVTVLAEAGVVSDEELMAARVDTKQAMKDLAEKLHRDTDDYSVIGTVIYRRKERNLLTGQSLDVLRRMGLVGEIEVRIIPTTVRAKE